MSCFTSSCCLSLDVENKKNNIEQKELLIQNTNKRSNKTNKRKRYFFNLNEGKKTTKHVINKNSNLTRKANEEIVK